MRPNNITLKLQQLEDKIDNLSVALERLSLSKDLPTDYTDYSLLVIPKGKYKINRVNFIESINQYAGAFTSDEWEYMIYIQSKELLTREELNKVENIFEEVRKIVGYLN